MLVGGHLHLIMPEIRATLRGHSGTLAQATVLLIELLMTSRGAR